MKKNEKHYIYKKKTIMVNALIEIIFFITYLILIFIQPRRNFYYVSLAGILIYVAFLTLAVYFYYKTGHQKLVRFFVSAFYLFQTAYLIALIASYAPAIGRLTFQFYMYFVHCVISFAMFINAILQHFEYNLITTRKRILIGFAVIVLMFMVSSIILSVLIIKDFVTYGFSVEYFLTLISYFVYIFGTNVAFLIEYYYYKIDEEKTMVELLPLAKKNITKKRKSK